MQKISVGGDRIHRLDHRDLCHDGKPRLLTSLGEILQPLLLEALERIGRGTRLVRTAANELRTALLDELRRLQELLTRLHRAGPRHHHGRPVADLNAADIHHRRSGMELAARELVALRDRDRRLNAVHRIQRRCGEFRLIADHTDNLLVCPLHHLCLEALLLDSADDPLNVSLRGICIHNNNHRKTPSPNP